MYSNFEISLVVLLPNITTNHAITYAIAFKRETQGRLTAECFGQALMTQAVKGNGLVNYNFAFQLLMKQRINPYTVKFRK